MRLYISTDTQSFITEPAFRAPVNSVTFKRGDAAQVNIQFVSGSTALSAISGKQIKFGLKESGDYDGDYLVYKDTYTVSGNDFVLVPSFNTEALNTLLGHDALSGNVLNDVAAVNTMLEVSWSDDGSSWYSTNTIVATVNNDVIKGSEGTPLATPDAQDWLDDRSSTGGNQTADSGKLVKYGPLGNIVVSSRLEMENSTGNGYFTIDCDNLAPLVDAIVTAPVFGGAMKTDYSVTTFKNPVSLSVSNYQDSLNVRDWVPSLSALNFILPTASNSRVGQTVGLFSIGAISQLSAYSLGGATIYGNVLSAANANQYYEFKCVSVDSLGTWIRTQ